MKNKIYLIALALLCTVPACKKYEEGPSFSFRSAKSRVEGKWKVESYISNNNERINVWTYQNARIVRCNSNGQYVPIEGPGIERYALTEVTFEFASGGDLTYKNKLRYEDLNVTESEIQCRPIWEHVNTTSDNIKSTWELDKKKENIIVKNGSTMSTYEIVMLKEKEMKFKTTEYGKAVVYTLVKE